MKTFAKISFYYAAAIIFFAVSFLIIFFKLLPKPFGVKFSSGIINTLLFYRIKKFGQENPDVQMLIVNHQSGIDIPVLEGSTSHDLAWVAKQELFDIPFLGLGVKLPNDIPLQRESKTALVSLLRDCKDRLASNRVVTIFPEGTRSRNFKMGNFKPGAKMVADKLQLKVQPVVMVGTSSTFDSGKRLFYPFKTIHVVYLDAFVADKNDKEWLDNTRNTMQKVYDEHAHTLGCR
jgi:1-acyl-sn-glycerol-3-phosphate acyltransferase